MIKETRPKNLAEADLYDLMVKGGWHVTKRGWPDFLCTKDDRIVAIEVKSKHGHRLKEEQRTILNLLAKMGAECYKWTPTGFVSLEQIDDLQDNPQALISKRAKDANRRRVKNKIRMTQRTIRHTLELDK